MLKYTRIRRRAICAPLILYVSVVSVSLLLTACGSNPLRDTRNPYYRRGYKLLQERKYAEAATAFEHCLRLDPQSAMAHLQLGILYEDTFQDPVSAVYHYDAFLKKRPESPRAEAVIRWKARAEKRLLNRLARDYGNIPQTVSETADTGPNRPLTPTGNRPPVPTPDGSEREELLLRRVRELALELQAARTEIVRLEKAAAIRSEASPPAVPVSSELSGGTVPIATSAGQTVSAGNDTLEPNTPGPVVPASAPGKVHVVVAGDTLSSLARRYYGSLKFWPLLRDANRNVLGKGDTLIVGRELRIPPLAELQQEDTEDNE